ncbi:hypothetical protein [Paracoccus sp. S1E-3]|uniref:hypothetical protein n=1 Tax=Paracoccus sp. S1E-3 TaxID=2756130 RepID=UPI0015EF69EC|nr:hypothetical protein [Paracoccus sp. S1E-3]MBA4489838.1 hypothetical protein [Paracoccus sp. S1E-3]
MLIGRGLGDVMPALIVAVSGAITAALFLGQLLLPLVVQPLVDLYVCPAIVLIAAILLLPMAVLVALLPRKS